MPYSHPDSVMYSQPQADALSYINATTGDAATVFGPALLGLVRSDARAARRSVSVLFAAVRGWAACQNLRV